MPRYTSTHRPKILARAAVCVLATFTVLAIVWTANERRPLAHMDSSDARSALAAQLGDARREMPASIGNGLFVQLCPSRW